MQQHRRGREFGVLLLAFELARFGLDRLPPVTLSLIAGMAAVYLGALPALDPEYMTPRLCVQPARIWYDGEWWRLLAPVLMHASDMHLYYNMVSLMWKGHRLERRVGSVYFLYLVAVFSVLCSGTMVGLALAGEQLLHLRWGLMHECAIGFSGVLFALKVLCNHYFTGEHRLLGLWAVSAKWAAWAELLLIQVLVPNASFTGHLAGIVVGMAYVNTPLRLLMDQIIAPDHSLAAEASNADGRWQSQGYTTSWLHMMFEALRCTTWVCAGGSGYPWYHPYAWWPTANQQGHSYGWPSDRSASSWWRGGGGSNAQSQYQQAQQPSYASYTAGLSEEEQMREAMQRSLNEQQRHSDYEYRPPPYSTPYPEAFHNTRFPYR